jgi:hypothetical protein
MIALNDEWALRKLHICVRRLDRLPVFAKEFVSLLVKDAADADAPVGAHADESTSDK